MGVVTARRLAPFALAALVLVLAACTGGDEDAAGGVVATDEPMPTLAGETLQGAPLSTARFRGDVMVVNVWATWCDPCRREQPALVQVERAYRDKGVSFVGINYRDDTEAALTWVEDFGVDYPSLSDPSGSFADDLEFPFLPDTYVVDRGGTIRYSIFGETSAEELSGLLDEVLVAGPAPTGT
jgi:DsbE subfamily thiol:disulfide oxidoreductase